jgi:hypothetical protein
MNVKPYTDDEVKYVSFTFPDPWSITYSTMAVLRPGDHIRWVEFVQPKPKEKKKRGRPFSRRKSRNGTVRR